MRPAVVVLHSAALPLARRAAALVGGEVHGARGRADEAEVLFEAAGDHLRRLFRDGRPLVAVMAAGAVIRILAPLLTDKGAEPPVLALAEDGSAAVPLLGGHHGANDLARRLAEGLGGQAAVTTAGDLRFGVALDAPPAGYTLENPGDAKRVMAELVAGAEAWIEGEAPWLQTSRIPVADDGRVTLAVTEEAREAGPLELLYRPRTMVLGIGAERGAPPEEAVALAERILQQAGVSPLSLACVASIDLKADEPAVHAVAERFGVPARFFDAATLERERPRLLNPSEIVFRETGCHGVSEGAALAAVGPQGALIVSKQKSARATAALARAPQPIGPETVGQARGRLFVVGIGPGGAPWRSPAVSAMVEQSTDLVGYSLYLDLLGPLAEGRTRHDFDLGAEELRVRHAMELAGTGRDVALVCSGDAGIYAMATLVFELLDRGDVSKAARRIAVEVSPGISALQAAAAKAGAPLGHDFCTISLSDLLTPWEDIQRRVRAAAEGDFVIAFYNPVSKRRRTQLVFARDVLLQHRPADTPVVLATNLGRVGESVRIVTLAALDVDEVDMLTVVLVGSTNTRRLVTAEGRAFAYTPRGYAAKPGTGIQS
ncbi:precorrin-3B C(17)-methyltransferase [Aureimonas jatrophae]|uniref:Cobalt-precorrin 5A hydrolase / precorrin-3B C17-methyltransferase n=1 Tax=Aureimonas jatrophae TaxID=1166073 RepID=A0A1H0D853_9HYPH|nr:precorrin-3B C(17)-methyltransferase [Aureimonas jatrophae]MBB3951751.1 cobalt-precorrin 5A hydrolase/precorrin-3B C17-methyltransferase [Aureimonas jatrophae]SDN66288.1 cobalt-precorrin 5A hydrolase / precorrin-3B C17-methyltransferase [Aureimonas jatrophae]